MWKIAIGVIVLLGVTADLQQQLHFNNTVATEALKWFAISSVVLMTCVGAKRALSAK